MAIMSVYIIATGAPDNRGTEFVIGYMANYVESTEVELYVTTSRTTNVDVHVSNIKSL